MGPLRQSGLTSRARVMVPAGPGGRQTAAPVTPEAAGSRISVPSGLGREAGRVGGGRGGGEGGRWQREAGQVGKGGGGAKGN